MAFRIPRTLRAELWRHQQEALDALPDGSSHSGNLKDLVLVTAAQMLTSVRKRAQLCLTNCRRPRCWCCLAVSAGLRRGAEEIRPLWGVSDCGFVRVTGVSEERECRESSEARARRQ